MKRALFVTFEGIEGTGKSTQIKTITRYFKEKGVAVFVTREPGGSPLGDAIRDVLLKSSDFKIDPMAELFLMEAARRQHVVEVLKVEMEKNDLILCDRFSDSSLAYQGGGRGLDLALINQLNDQATDKLKPDLTVLLDAPVEKALPRALRRIQRQKTGLAEDRFEKEKEAFHQRVREGFLSLAKKEPGRIFIVDATDSPEKISQAITKKIESLLKERK